MYAASFSLRRGSSAVRSSKKSVDEDDMISRGINCSFLMPATSPRCEEDEETRELKAS